jgi:hypothetical protein
MNQPDKVSAKKPPSASGLPLIGNVAEFIAAHGIPVEFLQRIQPASVERLALTHLAPYVEGRLQLNSRYVDPIRELYQGEILAGEGGFTIVIPLP